MNIHTLRRLEAILQKRSYISGFRFSKKDVETHDQIGRHLFSSSEKEDYPNVARWATHVAHLRSKISLIPDDGFQFLEEVLGDECLVFAKAQNERVLKHLGDPKEKPLYTRLLSIMDSKEKIPQARKIGEHFYNFWQDEDHKRGIWRRTSWEEYQKQKPEWELVFDLDALGKEENESWVWKGYSLLDEGPNKPKDRCLLLLSRGGADAVAVREFDLTHKQFVPVVQKKGFQLPEAKISVSYKTRDVLYVGTDFGPNSLTDSGYPRIIKEWKRGTPLADAKVVMEGEKADVSVSAHRSYENNGQVYDMFSRALTFYTSSYQFAKNDGPVKPLDIPKDADIDVFESDFLLQLREAAYGFPAGSLLACDVDSLVSGKPKWKALFEPQEGKSSIEGYTATKNILALSILENVQSKLVCWRYSEKTADRWQVAGSIGPVIAEISARALDPEANDELWVTQSSFDSPTTLSLFDASHIENGEKQKLKQLPPFFDSSNLRVEQRTATSEDGTKVPYFILMNSKASGPTPTLLYGYGGFEISLTPAYLSTVGAGWLERGYTFVYSNIRGGGEFGPKWHDAALKANRKKAYDDFIAIGEALVADKVTTPKMLGAMGGSNGGLLMGNMLVRRPDLFGAIVCQVPLLDMMRYSHLLAGASWMAEFGDPDTDDWKDFLHKYSPYHNVDAEVQYPPIFLNTSTRDDRVHPGHARKMTALLQYFGNKETWYYENMEGGHAGAADNTQRAFVKTLEFEFLDRYLNQKHDI
eukprot:GEMP01011984.1.p1 GENE.GEMP01011984.1~~GEMP01011984.1.p1  ORF type:complete len:791 (+),score=160.37 GEMP01011984.1:111-2375(+)